MAGLFDMLGGDAAAMQRQLDEQRAAQFAQQTQEQRLAGMGYKAGAGLGRGLAGAFGVDIQDPAIRRAAELRRVAQDYDITSSEGLLKMANAIKDRYPAEAQQLAQQALGVREKESVIAKNMREKQAAGLDEKIFATLAAKATPASVKIAQAADNDVSLLDIPENVKVSAYGQVLKDAGIDPSSDEFKKRMKDFAAAELESTRKGKGITNILPGQQVPQKEWLPFADYLDKNPTIKRTSDLISAAPSALETIRLSTTNDIASTALAPQLARMAGETGSLSANDVNRWAKAGGLDDRLIGSATSFFTGKTTVAKKEQAEKYVSAVFRGALLEQKRMLQDKAKEFGYIESPNYKARLQSIDDQLARFKKPSEGKPEATGAKVQPTGNPLIDKYLQPQPAQ